MIKITKKFFRIIILLGLLGNVIDSAKAATIQFNYAGSGSSITSLGSGSFSFADGLSQIGLNDLNNFNFNLNADVGDSVIPNFSFGLSDLTAFNAAVDQNLLLSSLNLTTNTVFGNPKTNSAGAFFAPVALIVTSINTPDGASTINGFNTFTTGTVNQSTVQSVDEPNILGFFAFAMLLNFFIRAKSGK